MPPSPTTAKAWLSTSTDSTPRSPEETFAAAFGSEGSAERRLDTLDDAVSSVAQPIAAVTSFYSTNSSTIKAAFLALADITKATELGSKVDAWIGTVDKVLVGVEGLAKSQPFPFVETAVLLVRGIVKLETERRENNRRTRALILQIADMMGALLQLHNVRDPELVTERGQSVQGRIQVLMQRIEADVTECGALIDAYHKHSLTSKFFFSGSYADQFKARGETIVARKGDIIFALSIHTTVTVDEVRATVRANNGMLKQLVALAEHKSAQEEELERLVADLGGRSKVLDSDELLTQVSCEVQARLVIDEDSGGGGRDKAPSASTTLSPRERHDLRLSLETILQENADHFAQKLEAQVKLMTAEIQLYIRLSTAEIIRRLDVGPYERIDHPDIRELWKQMRWRFSVKGHDFIKALQEYYFDKIAEGDRRAPVYDSSERTMTEDERKLQDDKWCLRFLGVEYEAPVLEAFDTDNSGFIRISEVNEFTNSIPDEWSLLQAVAYWAQGWSLETAIYARSVFRLLEQMRTDCENVLIENSRMFQWYFRSGWASDVDRLIYCAAEKHVRTMAWNQLDTMVRDNMARTEARLLKALTAFSYDIDEPHSVELVVGGRPLEQTLLPLLLLILRHHHRFIKYAQDHVYPHGLGSWLYDRGFIECYSTLNHIMTAVSLRIEAVQDSCRQHGRDPTVELSRFAGGIYEYFYKKAIPEGHTDFNVGGDYEYMMSNFYSAAPDENNPDFVPRHGEWMRRTVAQPALLHPPAPPNAFLLSPSEGSPPDLPEDPQLRERREQLATTFLALTIKDLRRTENEACWTRLDPTEFSDEEKEQFAALKEQLPVEEQLYYVAEAKTQIRQSSDHMGRFCDVCSMNPIAGVRYRCVICHELDMCSSCDQSQPHTFKMPNGQVHKSWHATLVVTRPVIREEANLRRPFIPLVLDGLMGLTAENVREEISDNAISSSSDSDGDDDSDGGRSPRYDPDESAVPLVVEPLAVSPLQVGKDKFTCSKCSQVLTGTRFVYSPEGGGLAMCPDCERNTRAAFCEVGALPAEYHIMFRLMLPLPEDSTVEVERQEVASAEQETAQLRKLVEEMGTRLAAMEARFSNVEYKLDTLLRLLS